MAELAALGVAASIIQVIDVAIRVASRINDYRKHASAVPKVLEHINNRLPTWIAALKGTRLALDAMSEEAEKAMKPCVVGCFVEIKALEAMIDRISSKQSDSATRRIKKAVISVKHESEIKEMDKNIQDYMKTLSDYHVLSSSSRVLVSQKTPPPPSSTCPFEQEPDFIERDAMNEVMSRCQPGKKLALMGIGGVGKSSIAIEYNYRIRKTSPQTWVFWVSAESTIAAARDFRKIAKAVQIPDWDEKGTDIFSLVRDWLKDDAHGPWTMILDNVDDVNVLTAPAPNVALTGDDSGGASLAPQIREFITVSQNGSILITSRNTDAAQMITGNCAHHVDVEEMNEGEAIALLKSKLNSKVVYTEQEATDLVKTVDYMPLAISQIAANISLNYPRLTLARAIEKLQNPSEEMTQLLENHVHETSRDVHRSNSIIKTWHLSFEYVCESSPSAARLLSLMCLFHRQDIPEALLVGEYEDEEAVLAVVVNASSSQRPHFISWKRIRRQRLRIGRSKSPPHRKTDTKEKPEVDFDADWRVLTNFALIRTNVDGCHFNMHRLVQHATKRWLELKGEHIRWTTKYVHILTDHFPQPEYDNEQICRSLLPHATQAITYIPSDKALLRTWTALLRKVAEYAEYAGDYSAVEEAGQVTLAVFQTLLDEPNEDMLKSLHDLGGILVTRKKYQKAEALLRKALTGRQILLGDDHSDTLASARLLGRIFNAQQKYEEAETLLRKSLTRQQILLGGDHADTLASARLLGKTLNAQKKYEEGEAWQFYAMETQERVFGREHMQTQGLMISLLQDADDNGRYEQAVEVFCRIHGVQEDTMGDEFEKKYEQMRDLAGFLSLKGDLDAAERIHREVVATTTRRYSLHSYENIISTNLLGEVLLKQGKLQEAAELYHTVVDSHTDLTPATREESVKCMEGLSRVLLEQGNEKEAEELCQKAVAERETLLGPDHTDTFSGVHTLATILVRKGQFEEAVSLFERAYIGMEKVCGPDRASTKKFLKDLDDAKSKLLEWREKNSCSPDNRKALKNVL